MSDEMIHVAWSRQLVALAAVVGALVHALAPAWHQHAPRTANSDGQRAISHSAAPGDCCGCEQDPQQSPERHDDCSVCRWLLECPYRGVQVEIPDLTYPIRFGSTLPAPILTVVVHASYDGRAPPV